MAGVAAAGRLRRRPIQVGLGPRPLINSRFHKLALERFERTAETFVSEVLHITQAFDYRGDRALPGPLQPLLPYWLFARATWRYRCLYLSFHGGPLAVCPLLGPLEPVLLRLAGVRVVVLPYGSDVQVVSRSPNPAFVAALDRDYPQQRQREAEVARQVDRWTAWADHLVGGCEWVDYMPRWDTLTLGHFAVDVGLLRVLAGGVPRQEPGARPLRVLHAPNHRHVKGTRYVVEAVEALQAEGLEVELELLEGVPNEEVLAAIARADVVVDQLVIGWYAMFAIEGMALGKPVLCYVRDDLERRYVEAGLLDEGELPLVRSRPEQVADALRALANDPAERARRGARGVAYVRRHHSLEAIGQVFERISVALELGSS